MSPLDCDFKHKCPSYLTKICGTECTPIKFPKKRKSEGFEVTEMLLAKGAEEEMSEKEMKRPCDEKGVCCWKHPKIKGWACPHILIEDPHLGAIRCVFPEYGSFKGEVEKLEEKSEG
jgi:hypothetical protein